jgi:hypothetical protein
MVGMLFRAHAVSVGQLLPVLLKVSHIIHIDLTDQKDQQNQSQESQGHAKVAAARVTAAGLAAIKY